MAPVLTLSEAPAHPHNVARRGFVTVDGIVQPAPAPTFGRTTLDVPYGRPRRGQHTVEALVDWGFDEAGVAALVSVGALWAER
jgi:alpha-methylacyl-CoA racemase